MIKLLIVDDSALMRRLLGDLFTAEGNFEVATARDGADALEQLATFKPDVVTLDVHMPQMDGLACLDRIMLERPTPVVMVSALTTEGAEETLEALELGAVDFAPKPAGPISLEIDTLAPLLVEKVTAAAGARIRRTHRLAERVRARAGAPSPARRRSRLPTPAPPRASRTAKRGQDHAVIIGCSTGGPPALDSVLGRLPADFPWPILVAQHMPATFTGPLAARLDGLCQLKVVEAAAPMPLAPGVVYVGRGETDLIVSRRSGGLIAMPAPSSPEHRWHPSVDRLVDSAMADFEPSRLVGILMTGMGYDGAAAMTRLRQAGGRTIAEAEETAVVWGMPGELVKAGGAEIVAAVDLIAERLIELVDQA